MSGRITFLRSIKVGDMVRTTTSFAAEDETNLAKVGLEVHMFEGLVRGFLEEKDARAALFACEYLAYMYCNLGQARSAMRGISRIGSMSNPKA